MDKGDDLFSRWLAAHRLKLPLRPLDREEDAGTPGHLVRGLCRLRLFWPVVSLLLGISGALLRVTARLYFRGVLSPRLTGSLLRLASRFGDAALAMMRNRHRWNSSDAGRRNDHASL